MASDTRVAQPKILILATLSGGYLGANSTGQLHEEYPPNTYILPIRSGAMFPESFYLRAFERGIDAILILYSGSDCPYKGAPEHTAQIVNRVYAQMKARHLDTRRLRLVAICTVCVRPFLREVNQMHDLMREIGLARDELAAAPQPA